MAQQENKIPLSKKGKREISPFIGHELLYDYLSGNLDAERRAVVEDHVKFSRDAQLDLNKIESGQKYADKLSGTVVSQPIISQINAPASYLSVLMQKSHFDKWPQGLKWGLEALVVVMAIVVLLTVTPWQKALMWTMQRDSAEVILAEVAKDKPSLAPTSEEKPEFADEVVAAKPTEAPVVVAQTAKTPAETIKKEESHEVENNPPAAVSGGFLYRGDIDVTNVAMIGPKITEKISEIGGRKAGSVELGWKKTPNSMYYHFTIPEAKYQDLVSFLGTYGKLRISKEKHPRVMPDGIIRLIITVDEAQQ
ncbi:MAG: zf-HC2 domain-containing protein [Bdellovibrio sp.]